MAPLQVFPHAPQFLGSLPSGVQAPLQLVSPWGHAQAPPVQTEPAGHALPQLPQLFGSLESATQAPLHDVRPTAQGT